jgi:hypothetical protein
MDCITRVAILLPTWLFKISSIELHGMVKGDVPIDDLRMSVQILMSGGGGQKWGNRHTWLATARTLVSGTRSADMVERRGSGERRVSGRLGV